MPEVRGFGRCLPKTENGKNPAGGFPDRIFAAVCAQGGIRSVDFFAKESEKSTVRSL